MLRSTPLRYFKYNVKWLCSAWLSVGWPGPDCLVEMVACLAPCLTIRLDYDTRLLHLRVQYYTF